MKLGYLGFIFALSSVAWAQEAHNHPREVHGVPGGVPDFCGQPTVTSVGAGAWSNPATWSSGKIPAAGDKILISARHDVVYDALSDANLACVEVRWRRRFRADANTRMKTANLIVQDEGYLEVGSPTAPVAPNVTAEIVITDQKIDRKIDPAELGTGIESLGKITMHGAVKSPTFMRLAEEALSGQTTLTLEQSVQGWKAGEHIVIPDTRQLRDREIGSNYKSQDEKLEIRSIAANKITLGTPLKYDHKGARNADDKLEFLPHIGNLSRNVLIRSENPDGTRGHMIFVSRAEVDLRFVEVRDMGRTRMGVLDNTEFDEQGNVKHLGTNQIGRYAIHFHHYFGPKQTPANGYQFTLAANADVFGFQLAAGALDTIRIPKFKSADMADDRETVPIDTTNEKVLEFVNNEAYGAIQTGVAFGWNGEIKNFRTWNPARQGLTVIPTDKLTIDTITVRGDKSVLVDAEERAAGVWVGNYLAKSITIRNADIQGMRTGVASPFFHLGQSVEPGRGDGSIAIENSYFRDYYGVVVATTYQPKPGNRRPPKVAVVRNSVFEPLNVPANPRTPPAAISMNYNMAPNDPDPRVPIDVYDFNKKPGDNFKVYYSLQAPRTVAPCNESRPAVDGWVCK